MNKAFDSIKQGLQEALDHARGNKAGVSVHRSMRSFKEALVAMPDEGADEDFDFRSKHGTPSGKPTP